MKDSRAKYEPLGGQLLFPMHQVIRTFICVSEDLEQPAQVS
jgi:hypothetical protein